MTRRYEEARLVKSSRTRTIFIAQLTELTTVRICGSTCANEDECCEMREIGLAEVARNKKLAHSSFTDIGRGPVLACERYTLKSGLPYERVGRPRATASRTSRLRDPACAHTWKSAPVLRTGKLTPHHRQGEAQTPWPNSLLSGCPYPPPAEKGSVTASVQAPQQN